MSSVTSYQEACSQLAMLLKRPEVVFASLFLQLNIILQHIVQSQDICQIQDVLVKPYQMYPGCVSEKYSLKKCIQVETNSSEWRCVVNTSLQEIYLDCFDGVDKIVAETVTSCHAVRTSAHIDSDQKNASSRIRYMGRKTGSWQWYVYMCLQPIIVVGGLFGNVFSFILMRSKEMKKLTFSYFLLGLSISDSLALVHFGMEWLDDVLPTSTFMFRIASHGACVVYPFIIRGCFLTSAWLMVAFTVDRAFAICNPFKAHKYISGKKALYITVSTPCICLLSQIYHPILFPESGEYCGEVFALPRTLATGNLTTNELMVVLSRVILLLNLPFLMILISNLFVVCAVRRREIPFKMIIKKPVPKQENAFPKRRILIRRYSETVMSLKLLWVSIIFFILFLPDSIVLIMDVTRVVAGIQEWYLYGNSYRSICRMIFTCNFAVNFLLYSIAFRKQMPTFCHTRKRVVEPMRNQLVSSIN